MEKSEKDFSHLFVPLEPEKLLNGRLFLPLYGQIIFRYKEEFVITTIRDDKNYTTEDYFLLPEGAPYQLINSKLIFMASAKFIHQEVSNNINYEILKYVKSHTLGKVITAPMDVHFDKKNILQPDILFVSIKRKEIIQDYIYGAPDFVVEILSPSTEKYDRNEKLQLFGKHGVEECWLINLKDQNIEQYFNENKEMRLQGIFGAESKLSSRAIKGFVLEVNKIFE